MILPGRLSLFLQTVIVFACAIVAPVTYQTRWFEVTFDFVIGFEVLLLLLILIDGLLLARQSDFTVIRKFDKRLVEDQSTTVRLVFDIAKPVLKSGRLSVFSMLRLRRLNYEVFDDIGFGITSDLPKKFRAKPPFQVSYTAFGVERGLYRFQEVFVILSSKFQFAVRRHRLRCEDQVAVQPSFFQVSNEFIVSQRQLFAQTGVVRRAMPGGELEFHRLRGYQPGDEPRHIDWKASARTQTLISREYEREQKQSIFLVVDLSSAMAARTGHRSLADEALSASLMLATVAKSQGDSLGFLGYGSQPNGFMPMGPSNPALLSRMMAGLSVERSALYNEGLAAFLSQTLRHDSIICIFSTIGQEDEIRRWMHLARRLSGLHRLLFVFLENEEILSLFIDSRSAKRVLNQLQNPQHLPNNLFPLPDFSIINRQKNSEAALAAYDYLKEKDRRLRQLKKKNVSVAVTTRTALDITTLSYFLQIRFSGRSV